METSEFTAMRLGMICRFDNSGLGTLSWEFARHLRPDKILLVQNGIYSTFIQRYDGFNYKEALRANDIRKEMEWLLDDIDVLLSIETFYTWDILEKAKNKGIKTVLLTMVELMPKQLSHNPNLFLCPSKLDFDKMPSPKVFIPIPVATDRLEWKLRKGKPKTFIHTASHGGMNHRKGTYILTEAMKYVESDIKLIIYSWQNILATPPKTEVRLQNFENYWQVWREGDVLIYPQDFNGICLPIIEAMSSGMGVITTDIYPFNEYMPEDLMFKPSGFRKTSLMRNYIEVEAAIIDPKILAQKIDEVAQKDITPYSEYGRNWAKQNSWKVLLNKYKQAIYEKM